MACTCWAGRGLSAVLAGLTPRATIKTHPDHIVLLEVAHIHKRRPRGKVHAHTAHVGRQRGAKLVGGLGEELGADCSIISIEVDAQEREASVLSDVPDAKACASVGQRVSIGARRECIV